MTSSHSKGGSSAWQLSLSATGIVFGDIGTSPLYAFQDSFVGPHKLPIDPFHVLGVLSLLVWMLTLVVTVETELEPDVQGDRVTATELGGGVSRVLIRYGFSKAPTSPPRLPRSMRSTTARPISAAARR